MHPAGLIFSIDLDPNTPGIQDTLTVQSGQTIDATIVLELTESTSLDSYRISLLFESAGLEFVNATSTPLAGFRRNADLLRSGDVVSAFGAESLQIGRGPSAPLLGVIGNVQFTALSTTGTYMINPWEDPIFDGSFDNNFLPLAPILNGANVTITAIPEPASMALMASVLLVLSQVRRFRVRGNNNAIQTTRSVVPH